MAQKLDRDYEKGRIPGFTTNIKPMTPEEIEVWKKKQQKSQSIIAIVIIVALGFFFWLIFHPRPAPTNGVPATNQDINNMPDCVGGGEYCN